MKSLKTVQGIAKFFNVLMHIVFVCCIIGAVCCVLSGAILMVLPEDMPEIVDIMAEMTPEFDVTELKSLGILCLCAAIVCVGESVVFGFGCHYTKSVVAAGTPFTMDGAKELRRYGILSLAIPFGAMIVASAISSAVADGLNISVNLSGGVLCILLSYLLQYGAELNEMANIPTESVNENTYIES